ncbi:MAG: FHA domain-containing protein [Woeseiaceae bacterium]|nr:FHA domain-containing protein [Woeseiaceae bacterium]
MPQQAFSLRDTTGAFETVFPSVAQRHDAAILGLRERFERGDPLIVLTADGALETNHVVCRLAQGLGPDVTVVRLTRPYKDAADGMAAITRSLGFDPAELSVSDLQSVFRLFLDYQGSHNQRTLLAVEHAAQQSHWLLDIIRHLVETAETEKHGLTVLLTTRPARYAQLQAEGPIAAVAERAGQPLSLPPFTPTETTEFVRQRVRAAGAADISQLFEFDAISRLHEISDGVPDEVAAICCRCLQNANLAETGRITEAAITRAASEIRAENQDFRTSLDETINEPRGLSITGHRLVIRLNDRWVRELLLDKGSVMLGRSDSCDISLPGHTVSRRHALISTGETGHVLRDLASRNGTFVGDQRVRETVLKPDDVIRIGDFLIEYESIAG